MFVYRGSLRSFSFKPAPMGRSHSYLKSWRVSRRTSQLYCEAEPGLEGSYRISIGSLTMAKMKARMIWPAQVQTMLTYIMIVV